MSKRVCLEAAALEVGRAKAAHRGELQATMADADRAHSKLGPPKAASTDASAISDYLIVAGIQVSTDALNRWLALLAVALVEFGGGLGFALSGVLREAVLIPVADRPDDRASTPDQATTLDTPGDATEAEAKPTLKLVSTSAPQKLVVPDTFGGRLMVLLNDGGGELYSGHRALGRALGCSAVNVGNVLRELAGAGHVSVQATKMGTAIRLAA